MTPSTVHQSRRKNERVGSHVTKIAHHSTECFDTTLQIAQTASSATLVVVVCARMACVVCLVAAARGMRACSCNTRIHVQCLAGLLDHNFQRCTVCLQTFTPEAVLAARRSQLSQPEIFETLYGFLLGRHYRGSRCRIHGYLGYFGRGPHRLPRRYEPGPIPL